MNESFSTTSSSSISSSTAGAAKVSPRTGEPTDDWTVEELVRWSLEQYRSKVIEQTSSSIASLREQCEKECEDVMKLHQVAVEMKLSAKNNNDTKRGEDSDGSRSNTTTRRREEENMNPQVEYTQRGITTETTVTAASVIGDSAGSSTTTISSSSNANITASSSSSDPIATGTIEITITSGPHASTTYTLHPTVGAPCLVGRSKGKKFVKNGISLFKDQEVSTTHGKFIVEEKENENTKNGNNSGSRPLLFFYFVDVGSTNGTVYNGVALEPNQRLLLENDMELKVGNSMLKILIG